MKTIQQTISDLTNELSLTKRLREEESKRYKEEIDSYKAILGQMAIDGIDVDTYLYVMKGKRMPKVKHITVETNVYNKVKRGRSTTTLLEALKGIYNQLRKFKGSVVPTCELNDYGLDQYKLNKMMEQNWIQRVQHGVYLIN